jgi:hypothetical protein
MVEILKAATMEISIFWDVTPCNLSNKPVGIITTLRIRVLEVLSSNYD